MSTVRSHTRRTASGKTVTVHRHTRTDAEQAAADQRKRDMFQRRVMAERQRTAHPEAYAARPQRTPGEKRKRRPRATTRAKRHAKKAVRLWRRHKVRAAGHAGLALGILAVFAAGRAGSKARSAWRGWKKRRQARKRQ